MEVYLTPEIGLVMSPQEAETQRIADLLLAGDVSESVVKTVRISISTAYTQRTN